MLKQYAVWYRPILANFSVRDLSSIFKIDVQIFYDEDGGEKSI
jgi:hypothetical protein